MQNPKTNSASLTLTILGGRDLEVGDSPIKVFDARGGRIGRALDCEWVLSNLYVSRHHATVSCADGTFYIEGVGANGVGVNNPRARLPTHQRHALKNGDRLYLDEYEISVVIRADDEALRPVQPMVFMEAGELAPPPSVLADQSLTLPKLFDETGSTNVMPTRFDATAFLRGAGLTPESVPPEMSALLGQILRVTVQGLIEVLRARSELRNQLRLPAGRLTLPQQHPLKAVFESKDALAALLRPRATGHPPAMEALRNALDDLRFHQLAMLAGMQAGFESVVSRFDPRSVMKQADRNAAMSLPRLGGKGRYWDKYVDTFEQVATYPDGGLQRLYGEMFADAYERQLEDLKRDRYQASA